MQQVGGVAEGFLLLRGGRAEAEAGRLRVRRLLQHGLGVRLGIRVRSQETQAGNAAEERDPESGLRVERLRIPQYTHGGILTSRFQPYTEHRDKREG